MPCIKRFLEIRGTIWRIRPSFLGSCSASSGFIPISAPAEHRSPTALIPTAVGVILVILGAIARKEAYRKHAMHAAAVVGVLGFLAAAGRFFAVLLTGGNVATTAGMSTATMAVLCGVFVALCVKSFIDARRRRKAGMGEKGL